MALDGRILYFNQFDDDVYFYFTFCIGYNTINITQIKEDKFDVLIDGNRFKDLMLAEKNKKKAIKQNIEREKRILEEKKKKEQEYYDRALKYNGKDYYEGKEKEIIKNNNKKPVQYDYNYYKEHKNNYNNNYYNNNGNNYNNNYGNNYNNYGNNYNNNYENNYNNNYREGNKKLNNNDIRQVKNNINHIKRQNNNQNMYDNNYNNNYNNFNDNNDIGYNPFNQEQRQNDRDNNKNQDNNNPYPSFSSYLNTDNNIGYNNKNFANNNNNYNKNYNNNYDNNNNNNNNDYMNELSEVFANQQNQNQNNDMDDLPTYSQIQNFKKKNSNENDGLVNFIGNLNKNNPLASVESCAPIPLNNVNIKQNTNYPNDNIAPINEDYDFGFGDDNDMNNKNKNNYNNYNNYNNNNNGFQNKISNELDKGRSKKKLYVNNSSLKVPKDFENNEEDEDNPYKDF